MKSILFVCVENANRSQMAAAFARMHSHGDLEVYSAGSRPADSVNPKAISAMQEAGYDLTGYHPQSLSEIPDIEYDFVATMGCGDECPFVRAKRREDWSISDPKNMPHDEFNKVRDLIEVKVKEILVSLVDQSLRAE